MSIVKKYWHWFLAATVGVGVIFAAGNQAPTATTTPPVTITGDYTSPNINATGNDFSLTLNLADGDYHDPAKTFTTTIQYNPGGNTWIDGPVCSFRGVAGDLLGPGGQVNPPFNCSGSVPVTANKMRLHVLTNATITASATYIIQ